MASFAAGTHTAGRGHPSPRPKARGCPYNHEVGRPEPSVENAKRFLSVESPSFTPLTTVTNVTPGSRSAGISPKAVAAAVFTPKSTASGVSNSSSAAQLAQPRQAQQQAGEWPSDIREFVPQQFGDYQNNTAQAFDPFTNSAGGLANLSEGNHSAQINPYAQESATAPIYQAASTFSHPLNYHLYAPIGPHRDNLLAYQRTTHDFFIPDHLREELQRKSEATLQTFSNSTLPQQIEHYHSLVALDTTIQKPTAPNVYPSWLYKAVSSKDGYTYCLRRLEGFRLTDERAVRTIQTWKRISNGNVVTVHDAFTTRAFGDSSLIVVTDYHPLSQTLAEKHFAQPTRHVNNRMTSNYVPDHELWGYIIQLASALKAIHTNGLAARLLVPQKILLTSKNRVRLNACGVLDITQFEQSRPAEELQQDDLMHLGRLILCLGSKNATAHQNPQKALEHITRMYGEKMKDVVTWLLTLPSNSTDETNNYNIDTLLAMVSSQMALTLDASLHEADSLSTNLSRELENARLVRLTTKLNLILERPDTSSGNTGSSGPSSHSLNAIGSTWSETGERYYLKLFRDYVYHQTDAEGRPVLDLGHILGCLNKLDTGVEEKIMLVSRDEQNCFVVSYRELKRAIESAWNELMKAAAGGRR
ncbi:hypothetical protein MBLNU457_g0143t2 [Dothideomycetes sp. NU457]